jgi:NDP-4-keto-2,6-dideoxyhexose 3-C-methyltransferase
MYKKIEKCRICGNRELVKILNLGYQFLTGVFPKNKDNFDQKGPLNLVKCHSEYEDVCGLVQLEHTYDQNEMYGENYGYRSGLNKSMVQHLENKVKKIIDKNLLNDNDLILDIGSNDATTLKSYLPNSKKLKLVGMDPTGEKFRKYYSDDIELIADFFSSTNFKKYYDQKPKIITSFSMFYDLEKPLDFMKEIYEILADEGLWVFEQSYMPFMLEQNSFDTICHEHLEFYSLHQIYWMTKRIGFQIIDVEFNDINGGSFSVSVKKTKTVINNYKVNKILEQEKAQNLNKLKPYKKFEKNIVDARKALTYFIKKANSENKLVAALGASTKGNVLLQYCSFTDKDIHFIGEVNDEKFKRFTPGTSIPIISEDDLLEKKPDFLIILPWHFKEFFLGNKKFDKFTLVFPLPKLEVVNPRI